MAGTTITGSVAGKQVAVNTSATLQQSFAAQILNSAAASKSVVFQTASGTLASGTAIVSGANNIVSGAMSVPSATVLLNGQSGLYINNGTTFSTVVAADNTNSTIINANLKGALIGVTGAGANLLEGLVKVNQFVTGAGGQDLVMLNGVRNSLNSSGVDDVLVGGPSTVSASASGLDNMVLAPGVSLSFVNGSAPGLVDSITGAANASVVVAGTGSTSITAGAGPETFYVDTASGNVTLNANLHAQDVFAFIQDGATGTGRAVVNDFAVGDVVLLHGYTHYNVTALAGTQAGSVLALSDGSQVTFNNVATATLTTALKIT